MTKTVMITTKTTKQPKDSNNYLNFLHISDSCMKIFFELKLFLNTSKMIGFLNARFFVGLINVCSSTF